jgi:hypothetical protein
MYLRKIIIILSKTCPDNLQRNSSVDKTYAGKEVTAGRNSDTPSTLISICHMIYFVESGVLNKFSDNVLLST